MIKVRKKYIVFVGGISSLAKSTLLEYIEKNNKKWELLILQDKGKNHIENSYEIDCQNSETIIKFVSEYGDAILCVTARGEKNIPLFQKIIPYLPEHVLTPTVESLIKATEKTEMRKAFKKFNPKITPKFAILKTGSKEEIESKVQKFDFPILVKPAGLAQARLVQAAYYPNELEQIVRDINKKMARLYAQLKGRGEQHILIEEIVEGDQFSVDIFIEALGTIHFAPFVRYTTGNQKGFDDFFSYEQTTPARISSESVEKAREVISQGVMALGLKCSSGHVELIRNKEGEWKIVEIGPRLGGFRSILYKKSFDIDLDIQDLNVRMGKKIILPRKKIGYTSFIKFFAKEEGIIVSMLGTKKAQYLPSFLGIDQHLKIGDKAEFAKNGGHAVFVIRLFNKDKKQFTEDKRKLEKMIHIKTIPKKPKLK
jgi:hypothetical protein